MKKTAYLIVICDKETNKILEATIWFSPEWEQSICLENPTYVAYQASADTYEAAERNILIAIDSPYSRYNWLTKFLDKRTKDMLEHWRSWVF